MTTDKAWNVVGIAGGALGVVIGATTLWSWWSWLSLVGLVVCLVCAPAIWRADT